MIDAGTESPDASHDCACKQASKQARTHSSHARTHAAVGHAHCRHPNRTRTHTHTHTQPPSRCPQTYLHTTDVTLLGVIESAGVPIHPGIPPSHRAWYPADAALQNPMPTPQAASVPEQASNVGSFKESNRWHTLSLPRASPQRFASGSRIGTPTLAQCGTTQSWQNDPPKDTHDRAQNTTIHSLGSSGISKAAPNEPLLCGHVLSVRTRKHSQQANNHLRPRTSDVNLVFQHRRPPYRTHVERREKKKKTTTATTNSRGCRDYPEMPNVCV
ncbi:hypothetical protein PMIN01_01043 [Paraphaeosphaeria minitans]|uniref:Uncharacterized protein n=1 Tax=Paraphaeosphaeria minitans TaxID=565426 RepID=A0A9P6KX06_9PLEO|nr:hypothetical protein PMIN01_01043 [Paraphaeosphaeria minitans]